MNDRTCSIEGCQRAHYARDMCVTHYRAARRAQGIDAKRSRYSDARECEGCGQPYEAAYLEQRYCDRTCRDLANMASGQIIRASRQGNLVLASRPKVEPKLRPLQTSCPISYGHCPECSTLWSGPAESGKVYCSRRCMWRAKDKRRGPRLRHHRKHAASIYRRDKFTCWLCGERTSLTWTPGDPLAPTLDHIIPRSLGGTHDPDNLGTAHAYCNSARGNSMTYTLTLAA